MTVPPPRKKSGPGTLCEDLGIVGMAARNQAKVRKSHFPDFDDERPDGEWSVVPVNVEHLARLLADLRLLTPVELARRRTDRAQSDAHLVRPHERAA